MLDSFLKELNEELSIELQWRYKEILIIKEIYKDNISFQQKISKIYSIKPNKKAKFILRNGILSLYSHWEGYFKFCLNVINEKLDILEIDLNCIDNSLLSLLFKDKHNSKYKNKNILFENIVIDTSSNLDWKRLEKLINIYNFDKRLFKNYESDINKLVKIRNGIAHGENSYHFENYKRISNFVDTVNDLMFLSRWNTLKFFKLKKYYKRYIK